MGLQANLSRGLQLPAISAPMFLVSGPEMVIAACRAGVIGSFPSPNARTPEILHQWMAQIVAELAASENAACRVPMVVVVDATPLSMAMRSVTT